jgi:DnaK suppressor protein
MAIDEGAARRGLTARRDQLVRQLDEIDRQRRDDGPIDIASGDEGQDTTRAATELGLEADLRAALDEVDAALRRIDDGTYGYDEETGEPIDPERLAAEPTARRNIR